MDEPGYGATGAGTIVLDVGGDTGALILHTPPGLAGAEIEISPHGMEGSRTHACVRERRGPRGSRYAAVYPGLAAGAYTVWGVDGSAAGTVIITGGQITNHDLTGGR